MTKEIASGRLGPALDKWPPSALGLGGGKRVPVATGTLIALILVTRLCVIANCAESEVEVDRRSPVVEIAARLRCN